MSGSTDRSIRLWSTQSQQTIKSYTGVHNYEVSSLDISRDNTRFVSGGGDKLVFVWDVATGRVISRFQGHVAAVRDVCWNIYDNVVISGSEDASVRVWDMREHQRGALQMMKCLDTVVAVRAIDDQIIVASLDGCIRFYDIRNAQLITDNLFTPISSLTLSNHERCLATVHNDNSARVIDMQNGSMLSSYSGGHVCQSQFIGCSFTEDDAKLIVGSEDPICNIYDIVEKTSIKLEGHTDAVVTVDSHPEDSKKLITGSFDCTLRIWELGTLQ